MTATASTKDRRPPARRRRAGALMAVALALTAALAGACTTREIGDFLYAGGKITYDSMKSRQHGE